MKIAVLGLGASLAEFTADRASFDTTIGVNDIWARVQTDYVVCLDMPDRFTPERLQVMNACRPRAFYSQLDVDENKNPVWAKHPCFVKIILQPAYGVDLINHPHLKPQTCERIKLHFTNLRDALLPLGCVLKVHGAGLLRSL